MNLIWLIEDDENEEVLRPRHGVLQILLEVLVFFQTSCQCDRRIRRNYLESIFWLAFCIFFLNLNYLFLRWLNFLILILLSDLIEKKSLRAHFTNLVFILLQSKPFKATLKQEEKKIPKFNPQILHSWSSRKSLNLF